MQGFQPIPATRQKPIDTYIFFTISGEEQLTLIVSQRRLERERQDRGLLATWRRPQLQRGV